VNRTEAATFNVAVGDVFDTLQSYLGSTYVNQFTKFGHTFTVFAQADEKFVGLQMGVRSRLLALPHYFVLANLASLIALFKFLRGERYARWEPIR
jgi:multidrug efflux pump subunit AcrB